MLTIENKGSTPGGAGDYLPLLGTPSCSASITNPIVILFSGEC